MNAEEPDNMEDRSRVKLQEQLAAEAATWVERKAFISLSERDEFIRWLSNSPEHVKEFLLASGWNEALPSDLAQSQIDVERLLSGANVIDVSGRVPPTVRSRIRSARLRRFTANRIGAAFAAAIALITLSILSQVFWPANVYSTPIGEQRTIALSDGSVVALNTQSRIRVDYTAGARNIHLTAGQAMFTVSHDAKRPFLVHVYGGAVVQAIGTKFDVRRMQSSTSVAVLEGRVQVMPAEENRPLVVPSISSEKRTKLSAGEGLRILDRGGVTAPKIIDLAEVNAWQQRRLVFRDDTLKDIAAEFNRYSRTNIRIESDELAAQRYSGVWDADHPEILLRYLSLQGKVSIDREPDAIVLRSINQSATE